MEYEHWEVIHAGVVARRHQREEIHEASRRLTKERAELIANGAKLKLKGLTKRSSEVRVKLYPWAAIRLAELADQRTVDEKKFCGNILEGVAHLWGKYSFDQNLYLSRCDTPMDAEVMIDPYASDQPPVSAGTKSNIYNALGHAVFELLDMGIEAHEIAENVATMFEVRRH